jgi:hypothetical protein
MRCAGHVARMGERRGVCRVLVGKPEGGNHLGDPGVDGSIISTRIFGKRDGGGGGGRERISLAHERNRWRALVNRVRNLRVPLNAGNFLTS